MGQRPRIVCTCSGRCCSSRPPCARCSGSPPSPGRAARDRWCHPAAGSRSARRSGIPISGIPAVRLRGRRRRKGPAALPGSTRRLQVSSGQRGGDLPRDHVPVRRELRGREPRLLRHAREDCVRDADIANQHLRHDVFAPRSVRGGAAGVGGAAGRHVLGGCSLLRPAGRAHQRLLLSRSQRIWWRRRGRGARRTRQARRRLDWRNAGRARIERRAGRRSVPVQQEHGRRQAVRLRARPHPRVRRGRSLALRRGRRQERRAADHHRRQLRSVHDGHSGAAVHRRPQQARAAVREGRGIRLPIRRAEAGGPDVPTRRARRHR